MTMTTWNLPYGQWSMIMWFKRFKCTILTVGNLDFCHGHGHNFDHLTTVIQKMLTMVMWSKIFDHMTMTPVRRSNGQKGVVTLPPP